MKNWKKLVTLAMAVSLMLTSALPTTVMAADVSESTSEVMEAVSESIEEALDEATETEFDSQEPEASETSIPENADEEEVEAPAEAPDENEEESEAEQEALETNQEIDLENVRVEVVEKSPEEMADAVAVQTEHLHLIVVFEGELPEFCSASAIEHFEDMYLLTYETKEVCEEDYNEFTANGFSVEYNDVVEAYNEEEVTDESLKEDVEVDSLEAADEASDETTTNEVVEDVPTDIEEISMKKQRQIKVALIDTGINTEDELLQNHIAEGFDKGNMSDENGHGTLMAEIIAANTNENVKIVPYKVFDENGKATVGATYYALIRAINEHVDVISLSVSGCGTSNILTKAVSVARERGIYVISAAGNNSDDAINYMPGNVEGTLNISAVNEDKTFAEYSNHGDNIDFSALGLVVKDNGTESTDDEIHTGTSISTARVSSMLATVLQYIKDDETTENNEVYDVLLEVCEDLGDKGKDAYFGWGYLSNEAVLAYLEENAIDKNIIDFTETDEEEVEDEEYIDFTELDLNDAEQVLETSSVVDGPLIVTSGNSWVFNCNTFPASNYDWRWNVASSASNPIYLNINSGASYFIYVQPGATLFVDTDMFVAGLSNGVRLDCVIENHGTVFLNGGTVSGNVGAGAFYGIKNYGTILESSPNINTWYNVEGRYIGIAQFDYAQATLTNCGHIYGRWNSIYVNESSASTTNISRCGYFGNGDYTFDPIMQRSGTVNIDNCNIYAVGHGIVSNNGNLTVKNTNICYGSHATWYTTYGVPEGYSVVNGVIQGNNTHAGITISSGNLTVENTNIFSNLTGYDGKVPNGTGVGIYANGNNVSGRAVISNTTIHNTTHGICVENNYYEQKLTNVNVNNVSGTGICVKNSPTAKIENATVYTTGNAGVYVSGNTICTINGINVWDSGRSSVYHLTDGNNYVTSVHVIDGSGVGSAIHCEDKATLYVNGTNTNKVYIHDCEDCGIYSSAEGKINVSASGSYDNVQIYKVADYGVGISKTSGSVSLNNIHAYLNGKGGVVNEAKNATLTVTNGVYNGHTNYGPISNGHLTWIGTAIINNPGATTKINGAKIFDNISGVGNYYRNDDQPNNTNATKLEIKNATIHGNKQNYIKNGTNLYTANGIIALGGSVTITGCNIYDNNNGVWNLSEYGGSSLSSSVTISNSTVQNNNEQGVLNENGTLYVDGGTYSDNTYCGIWVNGGTCETIQNVTATGNNWGIYNGNNSKTLTLTNCSATKNKDCGTHNEKTMTIDGGKYSENTNDGIWNSGTLKLNNNVEAKKNNQGVISNGTLTVNGGTYSDNTYCGIYVNGGTCKTIENVTATGNNWGIYNGNNSKTLTLTNCAVKSNNAEGVVNKRTLTIASGAFSGNGTHGVYNEGNCTINNGEFSSNKNDSGVYNKNILKINNGNITNNKKFGVVNEKGTLTVNAGNISSNNDTGIFNYGGTTNLFGCTIKNQKYGVNNGVNGSSTGTLNQTGGIIVSNTERDVLQNGYYNLSKDGVANKIQLYPTRVVNVDNKLNTNGHVLYTFDDDKMVTRVLVTGYADASAYEDKFALGSNVLSNDPSCEGGKSFSGKQGTGKIYRGDKYAKISGVNYSNNALYLNGQYKYIYTIPDGMKLIDKDGNSYTTQHSVEGYYDITETFNSDVTLTYDESKPEKQYLKFMGWTYDKDWMTRDWATITAPAKVTNRIDPNNPPTGLLPTSYNRALLKNEQVYPVYDLQNVDITYYGNGATDCPEKVKLPNGRTVNVTPNPEKKTKDNEFYFVQKEITNAANTLADNPYERVEEYTADEEYFYNSNTEKYEDYTEHYTFVGWSDTTRNNIEVYNGDGDYQTLKPKAPVSVNAPNLTKYFMDMVAAGKVTFSDDGRASIDLYATWDKAPMFTKAVDITILSSEVDTYTKNDVLEDIVAVDVEHEKKYHTDIIENGSKVTVLDFDRNELKQLAKGKTGAASVTLQAKDSVGNITKTRILIWVIQEIPEETLTGEVRDGYTRFVSAESYKASYADGGLYPESKWLLDDEYKALITSAFSNLESSTPIETWYFTHEDVVKTQDYIDTYGIGKSKSDVALLNWYNTFRYAKQ